MLKRKVIVVTHPELASGFLLAGVDVESASDSKEATEVVWEILKAKHEFGIIAIDEDLYKNLNALLKKELGERSLPLVIPFPASELYSWLRKRREEDYTSQMIREAIGYHIKLKRN